MDKLLYKIHGSACLIVAGSLVEEFSQDTTQLYKLFVAIGLAVIGVFFINRISKDNT